MVEKEKGDMTTGLIALTLLFAVLGGLMFAAMRMASGNQSESEADRAREREERRQRRGGAAAEDDEFDDDEDLDGEGDGGGRRNARRDERRQDAAARRDQMRERQQALDKKQEEYNKKQKEKEEQFQKKEVAEKKQADEKERKEQEEFEKWKDLFTVEAQGEDNGDTIEAGAVQKFIDHIKLRKVVALEDLAADFKMRTSVAIDRLKELEHQGRITGIFDDRGKFVYITPEEMSEMAKWLKSKGRINRADLVAACNKIVRLNPTDEDKAKLLKEACSAADALDSTEDA